MRDIWLVSDTHFNHTNILKFVSNNELIRPGFEDVRHMNEHMIECWNSVVKPEDSVYHLGDVWFGKYDDFVPIYNRLNGKKRVLVGNHDDVKKLCKIFPKVLFWRKFVEFNLLLTHTPQHESGLWDFKKNRSMVNVHGHIHQNPSPPGPFFNVSVEVIDYTPIHIEEVAKKSGSLSN